MLAVKDNLLDVGRALQSPIWPRGGTFLHNAPLTQCISHPSFQQSVYADTSGVKQGSEDCFVAVVVAVVFLISRS